jgi:Ferritin-like domain
MNEQTALGGLDPEIIDRLASRRDALRGMGKLGTGLALASAPVAVAALAKNAFGQTLPASIVSVLNFALVLEELEAEFYTLGLNAAGLIPTADRTIFTTIRTHEVAHVAFLRQTLGSAAVAKPTFDFTGGNGANNGPFTPFTNYAQFLVLSQGFEDLGVRAYKGQAGNLISSDTVLQAALTIHSVEARHASEVRRLRGEKAGTKEQAPYKGWITLRQVDAAANPIQPIYNAGTPAAQFPGEDNTSQGGVNIAALAGQTAASASEAFDEPLDRDTVLAIAGPFIAG